MKIDKVIVVLALLTAQSRAGDLRFPSVVISGNVYSNVTVTRVEYGDAVCLHSKGILRTPVTELPPKVRAEVEKAFPPEQPSRAVPSLFEADKDPPPDVDKTVDRFKECIRYTLKGVSVDWSSKGGDLTFGAGCVVKEIDGKTYGMGRIDFVKTRWTSDLLGDSVKGNSWPYAEHHDLVFLTDGKPIDLATTQYETDISETKHDESFYREFMWVAVPLGVVRKLEAAKTVEFRLGSTEMTLPAQKRAGLKVLLDRIDKDYTNLVEAADDK